MRVAFRTDASLQIGTGHVIRCLTLADALRAHGSECQFVCREHDGHLIDYIYARGYRVDALDTPDELAPLECEDEYAKWLAVDWLFDAHQTRKVLSDSKPHWLIVDHYALDHRWESVLRKFCKRIMVFDDLADRRHDCDLLLDQNYRSSSERYTGLTPAECIQLHGPDFALLKPAYAQRRAGRSNRSFHIERVLVYFGGGPDLSSLYEMVLSACSAPELKHIHLDIVVGFGDVHLASLKVAAAARGRANLYSTLPDLSEQMASADLAIGAGGATSWERCCLGLPSMVVSLAENQRPICKALAADDLILYLGHLDSITSKKIYEHLSELLGSPQRLKQLSERSMKIVDGNGVDRVLQTVISAS